MASIMTKLPAGTVALLMIFIDGRPNVGSFAPLVVLSTFMIAFPALLTKASCSVAACSRVWYNTLPVVLASMPFMNVHPSKLRRVLDSILRYVVFHVQGRTRIILG